MYAIQVLYGGMAELRAWMQTGSMMMKEILLRCLCLHWGCAGMGQQLPYDPCFSAPGPSAILAHTHNTDFLPWFNTVTFAVWRHKFPHFNLLVCRAWLKEEVAVHCLASRAQWPTSCFPSVVPKNHMIHLCTHGYPSSYICVSDLCDTLTCSLSHWWCMQALSLCEKHCGDAL